jgi:hypothetical protein
MLIARCIYCRHFDLYSIDMYVRGKYNKYFIEQEYYLL